MSNLENLELISSVVNNIASVATAIAAVWISWVAYKFNRRESRRELTTKLKGARDKVNSTYSAWISSVDKRDTEKTKTLTDSIEIDAAALVNEIEVSSSLQPELRDWLHALSGQMYVVREMRLQFRGWQERITSTNDTEWAEALVNGLLDIVKDSILEVEDGNKIDDGFWITLDDPALINGDGDVSLTIDQYLINKAIKKWISPDVKDSEQRKRLEVLVEYKIILEHTIAICLYANLVNKPVTRQDQFEEVCTVTAATVFQRFSTLVNERINSILGWH